MNKNLLIVILFLVTTSFLSTVKTHDKRLLRERSEDKPTYIPIQKGDSGFYVLANVSLKDNNLEKDSVKMLLSTYSSISLLVGQCLNFSQYDCQNYKCEEPNGTIEYSFPYFTAEGPYIKADTELGDWNLNTEAILSTRCIDGEILSYGHETYGILSLGVNGNAWANFKSKDPTFSLFFPKYTEVELTFSKDLRRIKPGTQPIVLHVDNNWRIQYVHGVKVGNYIINNIAKLMFDVNEDTIAFSLKTFKRIIIGFNHSSIPINCENNGQPDFYRPNCTYYGELKDLPNIAILAGNQVLIIHPEQYVKDPETFNSTIGHLTLNIKAIYDVVHTPENHVTTDYKDYIIVGFPFMKDYYVVFNGSNYPGSNNIIEFYIPNNNEVEEGSSILQIIIPIVVVFLSIPIGICLVKKRAFGNDTLEKRLLANAEEEHHPTQNEIQNPLQNNNEESRAIQRDAQENTDNISIIPIPNQTQSEFGDGSLLFISK